MDSAKFYPSISDDFVKFVILQSPGEISVEKEQPREDYKELYFLGHFDSSV